MAIEIKWARKTGSTVNTYSIWRAMVGFKAPIVNLDTKTLELKINGQDLQTVTFGTGNLVSTLNSSLVGATASLANSGTEFILRSNIKTAPGSIEIVGGTALTDLGLTAKLITEKSDVQLIATQAANIVDTTIESFSDPDGIKEDWYAISADSGELSPMVKPIKTAYPLCSVEGIVCDLQGQPMVDVEVTATIQTAPSEVASSYITKDVVRVISNKDGIISLPLMQGALVKIEIPAIGLIKMVTIPAQSYIFLKDILVDEEYTYPIGYRG